VSWL
jgi:hypothetical protein